MPETIADVSVDAVLLQTLMDTVSIFRSTGDGGVDRPALTDGHRDARDWLASELRGRSYRMLVDGIGTLSGRLNLAGPGAPLVMIGSHLHSQPRGGWARRAATTQSPTG